MAGDWIKLQKDTFDKPEVLAIASRLGIDPDAVVGKLARIWSWFDTHTTDGNAQSVTFAFVDRHAGVTGFAEQMEIVGWLSQNGHTLSLPNFDYHTGETAKKRALGKNRAEKARSNAKANAESNADSVTKTSLEKRREEKSNTGSATTTLKGGAPEETETEGFTPTQAGAICMAIKRCGVADVNPGHPRLSALIDAGATEPEFTGFARTAAEQGKGFAWVLGAVEGERKRAASMGTQLHRGPLPQPVSKQAALEARNASIVEQLKREHAA